jgi:CTP:molybdopterin cytidylyltransferase MocA
MKPAAIVLAAGEGRRFGSPKQLALLHGRPLLQHVLDAVNAAPGVGEVLLVLGAHADAIEAGVRLGGARIVRCDDWREGMAASLRAGVAALAPDAATALILLGDQPLVTAAVIHRVLDRAAAIERADGGAVDAVRVSYAGVPGHPVLLGRKVLERIPTLRGDVGARDLLGAAEVRLVEGVDLGSGVDVDTPAQLAALTGTTL